MESKGKQREKYCKLEGKGGQDKKPGGAERNQGAKNSEGAKRSWEKPGGSRKQPLELGISMIPLGILRKLIKVL